MIKILEKDENLDDYLEGKVLVDFFATWCGPCKMLAPELESLDEENLDLTIIKVDVDEHLELARNYKVMSVPTMLFFKDKELIKTKIGYMDKEDLIEEINY